MRITEKREKPLAITLELRLSRAEALDLIAVLRAVRGDVGSGRSTTDELRVFLEGVVMYDYDADYRRTSGVVEFDSEEPTPAPEPLPFPG